MPLANAALKVRRNINTSIPPASASRINSTVAAGFTGTVAGSNGSLVADGALIFRCPPQRGLRQSRRLHWADTPRISPYAPNA